MKMKWLALIFSFLLMLSCISCGDRSDQDQVHTSENPTDFLVTNVETYTIDNPVCPLQYPLQWKDFVKTEVTEIPSGCTVKFTAELEGQLIPLFSVSFCDSSEEGFLLGTLKTEKGEKKVYLIELFDQEKAAVLSQDAAAQYNSMSHDVNVIISKLVYDQHMTIAG